MNVTKLIVLAAVVAGTAGAAEFHVSPAGSDANPGTAGKPFATLERARDALRGARGGEVIVHGGMYVMKQTLVLTPQDSGDRFVAAKGETPVFTSAHEITGWKLANSPTPGLADAAKGKVWVADVPKGWRFHFLYVNGRPATRSRSVNNDNWRAWGRAFSFGPPTPSGQLVTFRDKNLIKNLPSNGDVEMCCILYQYGVMGYGVMTDFDPAENTGIWHSKQLNLQGARGGSETDFRLENALRFIGGPGEWAVDSAAGKVYYWPKPDEDLATAQVAAPTLCELVRVQGDDAQRKYVHHVVLDGLTLTCTDRLPEDRWPDTWTPRQWENPDAMIFMEGVENCAVRNCRLYRSGAYGITLYRHALSNEVSGCEIGWTGSGGVQLFGFGAGFRDENHDNVVRRNYIHDQGILYWHSPNIQIFGSGNNWVDHNFLAMSAYNNTSITGVTWYDLNNWQEARRDRQTGIISATAYSVDFSTYPSNVLAAVKAGKPYFTHENFRDLAVHSCNNKIFRNIVVECCTRLAEGGSLYSWYPGKGNQYVENVIYISHSLPGSSIIGLDDRSEYFTVTGNVIWCNGRAGCGPIGVRAQERGDVFTGNVLACCDHYGDAAHCDPDPGRGTFDELARTIEAEADKAGGWPGNPDINAWIEKLKSRTDRFELTPGEIKKMHRLM